MDAWDLYQRGISYLIKTTREDIRHALELFRQSSVADPEFASSLAAIAVAEFIKLTVGFNEDHAGLAPAAHEAAMRAVALDDLYRPCDILTRPGCEICGGVVCRAAW